MIYSQPLFISFSPHPEFPAHSCGPVDCPIQAFPCYLFPKRTSFPLQWFFPGIRVVTMTSPISVTIAAKRKTLCAPASAISELFTIDRPIADPMQERTKSLQRRIFYPTADTQTAFRLVHSTFFAHRSIYLLIFLFTLKSYTVPHGHTQYEIRYKKQCQA